MIIVVQSHIICCITDTLYNVSETIPHDTKSAKYYVRTFVMYLRIVVVIYLD